MLNYLKRLIDPTDQSTSSRRFISLGSFLLALLVGMAIIVLCFKVALDTGPHNVNADDALHSLLYLMGIVLVFVLIINQIITWQNINDTARIITGAPGQIGGAVAKISDTVTHTEETLKEGI